MPDNKFDLPSDSNISNANTQLDSIKENENKSPIGQGRSLADLKKLAQASVVKNDSPSNKVIDLTSNKPVNPNLEEHIQEWKHFISDKHADNLIKLLENNFANSRERVIASNKIRKYFSEIK